MQNRNIRGTIKFKNKKARYLPVSTSLNEVLEEYLSFKGGDGEDYLFPSVINTEMSRSVL